MAAAARVTPKSGTQSLGDLLFVCPVSQSSGLCFTKCPWKLCWKLCVLPLLEKSGGVLPVALKPPTWCWRQRAASNPEPSKLPQRRRSWVEKLERPWVCSCFPAPLSLLCWGRGTRYQLPDLWAAFLQQPFVPRPCCKGSIILRGGYCCNAAVWELSAPILAFLNPVLTASLQQQV